MILPTPIRCESIPKLDRNALLRLRRRGGQQPIHGGRQSDDQGSYGHIRQEFRGARADRIAHRFPQKDIQNHT
jgi:hypothetical protein